MIVALLTGLSVSLDSSMPRVEDPQESLKVEVQNGHIPRRLGVFPRTLLLHLLSAGVRQGCLLSPTLFNIFLERIMTDALEDHEGTDSTGGRTITNLRFADCIDGLAGEKEELAKLVERLDKASAAYGMVISAKKTKLLINNTSGINTEIKVNGQKLETVTSFKYLGSVMANEGSKPEILFRIALTNAALTRLKPVWNYRSISVSSKVRLMRSLVTSTLLYACESLPSQ